MKIPPSVRLIAFYFLFILFLIFSNKCSAQNWGGFIHPATESFYTKNLSVSFGVSYKEFRLGYYHQSAYSDDIGRFLRRGVIAEAGIFNIDKICYISAGLRVMTTNSEYVTVVPHGVIAWRIKPWIEIPIVLSTYDNWLTGSIGLRLNLKKQ